MQGEYRTTAQLREHYEIEKELAAKLRNASREERCHLYTSLYNELFQKVPSHPQLAQKSSPRQAATAVASQIKFLGRFLNKESTFLEVGSGDCALSLEAAKRVKQVYAVDVCDEITKGLTQPRNFQLILSDGCGIPVPRGSVDVAYSNQLMEHLHPDDAFEQLQNIYNALSPGGIYICLTPNRLGGPHDISRYFDRVATGFHMKEYTISEINILLKKVGFSKIDAYVGARGTFLRAPLWSLCTFEALLDKIPYSLGVKIARSPPVRLLLGIRLVAIKLL